MNIKSSTVVLPVLLLATTWVQAADVARGKELYATCAACHGAGGEGNQALNAPVLAGQSAWYVASQLEAFQKGYRGTHEADTFGAQMKPMADQLADEAAIQDVAAYVASLPAVAATDEVAGDAEKGKALYATCAACHGAKAEGNEALHAPRLANQAGWYLVRQLQNFKQGIRGKAAGDTYGMQMAPMAASLAGDEAIADVVAYIATLR